MKTTALLIACALPLTACNKSPEVHETNASVSEVANAVRESGASERFVNPGQWESKVTIEQIDIPGLPPEMAQRMNQTMAASPRRT